MESTREGETPSNPDTGTMLSVHTGRGPLGRVGLSSQLSLGRLTSLRSRDFTLSEGYKKAKKIFEPNIHAVRKIKEESREDIHVASKKERRRREERRRENRGRKRETPQTIQSHSIFEQGPASITCKTVWRSTADICSPITSTDCKSAKEDSKEFDSVEDEILLKLQRDDFIDDPGLRNDAKLHPVELPFCQFTPLTKPEIFTATATYKESSDSPTTQKISYEKSSPPKVLSGAMVEADKNSAEPHKQEKRPLLQLFRDLRLAGKEELLFIQLPDCTPGISTAQKPSISTTSESTAKKDIKREKKKSANLQAREMVGKRGCSVLSEFQEGSLGKLQIRQSGKMELKLGDIVMDVSEGAAFSFLQQLVSVCQSDGHTGDMIVLGNVHHKLVLSPSFEALLKQVQVHQEGQL